MEKRMHSLIKNMLISPDMTVKETMETITHCGKRGLPAGIAIVVDAQEKIIGVVTDGDIRKSIVKGINLSDPVEVIMTKNPILVYENQNEEEMIASILKAVKETNRFASNRVDKVIVVNDEMRVVDVFDFLSLLYKQDIRSKKVCVIGTGYIGLTLSVVIAREGFDVTGFDINRQLINELNSGTIGFYEKDLLPLLKIHLKEKNLKFTADFNDITADIFIITVGTPVDEKTGTPVMEYLEKAAGHLGEIIKKENIVILRSTVPVGTTRDILLPILERVSGLKGGKDFYLSFAPERVVEGNVIQELTEIPQIIGSINKKSLNQTVKFFQRINPSIVALDSLEEAEMVKMLNNAFRDLSFAFANKIAQVSEKLNLDVFKIIKAANEGYPRNPIPLPSPGVGGYCLTKDPYLMAHVVKNIDESPDLFTEGRKINEMMPYLIVQKIETFVRKNNLKDKKLKIFILGFAYKGDPETSDIRGSSTIDVLNIIRSKFGKSLDLYGYDPMISRETIEKQGVIFADVEKGFEKADGVLFMNNNRDFEKLDIFSLIDKMNRPCLFFDGWYKFFHKEILKIEGLKYESLGGGYN